MIRDKKKILPNESTAVLLPSNLVNIKSFVVKLHVITCTKPVTYMIIWFMKKDSVVYIVNRRIEEEDQRQPDFV